MSFETIKFISVNPCWRLTRQHRQVGKNENVSLPSSQVGRSKKSQNWRQLICECSLIDLLVIYCILQFMENYFIPFILTQFTLFRRMCIECIMNRNCNNEINLMYQISLFIPFISYPVSPQTKASNGCVSPFDITSKSRGFGSSQKRRAKCLGAKYRTVTILYSFSIAKRSFFNMSGSKFNQ